MAEICAEIEANSNWPKRDKDQTLMWVGSWFAMFGTLEKAVLLQAVRSVLLKYPEVKPNLVSQELEILEAAKNPSFITPEEAWRRLQQKIGEGWTYSKLNEALAAQNLKAISYAVDSIGWKTIVESSGESLSFIRKEFIQLIKNYTSQERYITLFSECDPKVKKLIHSTPIKAIQ